MPETVEAALRRGARTLRTAGIDTARLDARVLLAGTLGEEPSRLLPGDTRPVPDDKLTRFNEWLVRRAAHEPVSRILGVREFFGRDFRVTPAVLDPRADSEATVALALRHISNGGAVLDLGTGSGCLLLTILAGRSDTAGTAIDLSPDALGVARENAESLGLSVRTRFIQSHWFDEIDGMFDLIVSNPPYIARSDLPGLMPEVRDHDPSLALDGGTDGLDAYRVILAGAPDHLSSGGTLVLEIGAGQSSDIEAIAGPAGLALIDTGKDLAGHTRAMAFTHHS